MKDRKMVVNDNITNKYSLILLLLTIAVASLFLVSKDLYCSNVKN